MDNLDKAYILVVDDNPQNLKAIGSVLKEFEHLTVFASSAKEALRHVLRYNFAVILLDVQMPDMDGFEAAHLIRSRERSSYTPIIFLSAWHKDEAEVNRGYKLGGVDYILKPINPDILKYKVNVFVNLFTKSSLAVNLQNELKKRLRAEQQAKKQQRQLELAQLERTSTMEEMASAMAHELNQPLTTIANYIKGCVHRLNEGKYKASDLIEALQLAGRQAERAGAVLHRIKNFIRKSELYLEPVAIQELIANIPTLLPDEIVGTKIQLIIKPSKKPLPKMQVDKIQLEQVLLNLLRNSIDVLENSAQLAGKIIIETLFRQPKTLVINIKDNGPGIDPATLPQLFDLYYTTKSHGMGMGLSICRTIIEAHKGNITAFNNRRGGACFQITLPVMDENAHLIP
ncbi:MAG: response regulator receiver sensor hybrid histidine kinase [Gammaproteobacteria bacterium]|jgi:C4-dicarboxylate-specific signal transduction histidine kinase|nr:response regulator receiver sensor hybrid histidine kinase [Gammaproteobacteria bacterium]